eukprot:12021288-Ditylum_brightwellii.AAC.1
MSSKEDNNVLINKGGHQGGMAKDGFHTSEHVCSDEQITLLSSRKDSPSLNVAEHEVQFNHMRDTVEDLSQLKDNDLEEGSFREADLNKANTNKATGH